MADVLTGAEGNIVQLDMVRSSWHCGVREPIMLDNEDTHQLGRAWCPSQSTGESLTPLAKEYDIPTEKEGCQTGGRQSDNFIVPLKSGNADRGKEVTQ